MKSAFYTQEQAALRVWVLLHIYLIRGSGVFAHLLQMREQVIHMYLAHPRSKSGRKKKYQIEAMIMGFKMEGVDRVTVTFLKTFWCALGRENEKNDIFTWFPGHA